MGQNNSVIGQASCVLLLKQVAAQNSSKNPTDQTFIYAALVIAAVCLFAVYMKMKGKKEVFEEQITLGGHVTGNEGAQVEEIPDDIMDPTDKLLQAVD